MRLVWIAAGGALGAVLRWLLVEAFPARSASGLPAGTLLVNVLGCAAIGALGAWLVVPGGLREEARLFLVTGLLGGFTTMSAFAWETVALARAEAAGRALLYVALSNALCVGAAALAFVAARAARG